MKRLVIISTLLLAVVVGCKKEPETPPANTLNAANAVTIDTLRAWQQAVSPNGLSITDDYHVYGIITMDESDGNLYKNLYMQDHTSGIQIRMLSASDYAVGDSIRINLNGAYLSEYGGVIQLDSINPDEMIVRRSSGNVIAPVIKTIPELTVADEGLLVQINNVQFSGSELGSTYADHINQSSQNRILEDCDGYNILVRTSGFCDYAGQTVKQGNGSIVAIVSRFDQDLQLYIRSIDELTLDNERCAGELFTKDFEDNSLTSGGWVNFITVGSTPWIVDYFSGNNFGKCTNWDGSNNEETESWLISPEIDLTGSTAASMSFLNDVNYYENPLELLISTDYTGSGNPAVSGTWTDISGSASWDPNTNSWGFHDSGSIDLSQFIGNTIYIAFKYTGSDMNGSTWEIDDIKVIG